MRGKLLFVTGAAVGYVLGARAGRKRYDQLRAAALKVWDSPGVQKQVDAVEDFVAQKVGEVPEAIFVTVKKAVVRANDRRREARKPHPAASTRSPSVPGSSSARSSSAGSSSAGRPASVVPSGVAVTPADGDDRDNHPQ